MGHPPKWGRHPRFALAWCREGEPGSRVPLGRALLKKAAGGRSRVQGCATDKGGHGGATTATPRVRGAQKRCRGSRLACARATRAHASSD